MADLVHNVVAGDTLSEIAVRYGVSVSKLLQLNPSITDPDFIVIGQKIKYSGTAEVKTENTTSKATVTNFGIQSNSGGRTVYATWDWDKDNTENYEVKWYYDTGDNVWFIGSTSNVEEKQAIYNAPNNAIKVKFIVKPISEKKRTNGGETDYWTAGWSTAKYHSFEDNPAAPPVPTVNIADHTLTATLENLNESIEAIQFQIVRDDSSVYKTAKANVTYASASYSCTVAAGSKYKVRARSVKGSTYSEWSNYSSNVDTIPSTPTLLSCAASSATSIRLAWSAVSTATTYEIEYATEKSYFEGSNQTTTVNNITTTSYDLHNITSGDEYFLRVRAVNSKGNSGWSEIRSATIGKEPAAPTTWSSTTTCITGEALSLYWVHNSVDGSSQTFAEVDLYFDGVRETYTIKNTEDEDEKDKTSVYTIQTKGYAEGVVLQWRVRTAGVTKAYGEWSVMRTVDIYAPPTLELKVLNSSDDPIDTLTQLPFFISGLAGPKTQAPISYHVSIVSNETYDTVDNIGNNKIVNQGDEVYSRHYDINTPLFIQMSAGDITLENNISYTVICTVSMDSGLTVKSEVELLVEWADSVAGKPVYEPNAEIGIDPDTYTAIICPFVKNNDGTVRYSDYWLSVYRREFDGTFTKLITGLDSAKDTYITDPHPSLDYARYRVVAISKTTGDVSYYDLPGYPVGGKAVVIQWDERWSNFDVSSEDSIEQPTWGGSMLKLPYNIDVADNHQPDVEFAEYIGRSHPVAYYGTQRGETATWNVSIDKKDKETLYAIRRLAVWMGDVYIREPSGSGYWANVAVSFGQTHNELIIPVTFEVTRVEGGA